MLNTLRRMRHLATFLSCLMVFISVHPVAMAGMVGNTDLLMEKQVELDRNELLLALDRTEIQEALTQRGVDPEHAKQRVAEMTHEEIAQLKSDIDNLPAGGILGTILLIMVILIFTDLAGWTDVYPRI